MENSAWCKTMYDVSGCSSLWRRVCRAPERGEPFAAQINECRFARAYARAKHRTRLTAACLTVCMLVHLCRFGGNDMGVVSACSCLNNIKSTYRKSLCLCLLAPVSEIIKKRRFFTSAFFVLCMQQLSSWPRPELAGSPWLPLFCPQIHTGRWCSW